jgi:hypothetical protein
VKGEIATAPCAMVRDGMGWLGLTPV